MSRRRYPAQPRGEVPDQPDETVDFADAQKERVRIDVWLWRARFVKSRTQAAQFVVDGYARIAGRRCEAASRPVGIGDVLTLTLPLGVRVIRIVAIGTRRGPAPEARALYADIDIATMETPQA